MPFESSKAASAHSIKASVGAGKTRCAIDYMVSLARESFIYVAPTVELLEQTKCNLLSTLGDSSARPVVLIHHKDMGDSRHHSVGGAVLDKINTLGKGAIVLTSTTTFLRIAGQVKRPEDYRLIIDESLPAVSFIAYHLGKDNPAAEWESFDRTFQVDPEDNFRVSCRWGEEQLAEWAAAGKLSEAGQSKKGVQDLCAAVLNPVYRCELVDSSAARLCMAGKAKEVNAQPYIKVAAFPHPDTFGKYRELIFLEAMFDETPFFHIWAHTFGVTFESHPAFDEASMRDLHESQGRYMAFGYVLPDSEAASKAALLRHRETGAKPDDKDHPIAVGKRRLDAIVEEVQQYFAEKGPFLFTINDKVGYDRPATHPQGGKRIPTQSQGSNAYREFHNIAVLAVTSPRPDESPWLAARTGLGSRKACMTVKFPTTYQAVGRTSMRDDGPGRKVAITLDREEAWKLHRLFAGSEWLGKIGNLPPLEELEGKPQGERRGSTRALAGAIADHLRGLPESTDEVSSPGLKRALALETPRQAWSRAVDEALEVAPEWQREGHRLVKVAIP